MKKRAVYMYPVGSGEFVAAHAKWRKSRNRKPSMSYAGIIDPEKALAIAIKDVEAHESEKETIRLLKNPMLQCLARVIREIEEQFGYWNQKVMKEANVELGLEFVSAKRVSEDKWIVQVMGNTWTKRRAENIFTVTWMSSTCPAHFHLFERGRHAFGMGVGDLYCGVVEPNSRSLAKEFAIYSHKLQIPGVLSRL